MLTLFLSPIPFVLAFILYIASDIIKQKLWAKFCKYIALIIFVITILVWFNSFSEKVVAGRIGYQAMLVTSVTYHVEKELKKGNYQNAEIILKNFNANYQYLSHDNKKLKIFIKDIDIPLFSREIEELENKIEDLNKTNK